MFDSARILLCALFGVAASAVALIIDGRRGPTLRVPARTWALSAVVGVSTLLWRSSANIPSLNDDPIPWVSPNDILSPVVTFIALELVASLGRIRDQASWARTRALLTIVAFVVNVLAI